MYYRACAQGSIGKCKDTTILATSRWCSGRALYSINIRLSHGVGELKCVRHKEISRHNLASLECRYKDEWARIPTNVACHVKILLRQVATECDTGISWDIALSHESTIAGKESLLQVESGGTLIPQGTHDHRSDLRHRDLGYIMEHHTSGTIHRVSRRNGSHSCATPVCRVRRYYSKQRILTSGKLGWDFVDKIAAGDADAILVHIFHYEPRFNVCGIGSGEYCRTDTGVGYGSRPAAAPGLTASRLTNRCECLGQGSRYSSNRR